ncbi:polyphosphate polymerase domain-containing protein [Microbacterium sp. 18062]|uniref:polyphosphate polymerase domain-containing protein n=1 Tax=Microbacterium sp. 18062 TaxID=2681410 RepID=UPI00135A0DF1|nr:polyphosphate polymerase domain-containing protein [Microbacterium sp. 18062]
MSTSVALDRFAPIALDTLVAEAALLTRVDRKYTVPRSALGDILSSLPQGMQVLEIDGERAFSYESVYFDTPDLLSFRMAAQPRRRRFKLRTRAYLDTCTAYLEMKTRGARATTVKERISYDPAHTRRLTAEGREYAALAFEGIGVPRGRAEDLEPVLTTRYRRATLLQPDGVGRATIDVGLEWEQNPRRRMLLPELAIVETKSATRASELDRTLWRWGFRPATVSKYATGLAAMNPELPRNRWSRVLRDAFDPAIPPTDTDRAEEPTCPVAA